MQIFGIFKVFIILFLLIITIIFTGIFNIVPNIDFNKEEVLNQFNQKISELGDKALTTDNKLQGKRTFGIDKYTGTYNAGYKKYDGTEILFGGTDVERKLGNKLEINIHLNKESGDAVIYLANGKISKNILIEGNGEVSKTIEILDGSNYIILEGNNFSGNVEIEIK